MPFSELEEAEYLEKQIEHRKQIIVTFEENTSEERWSNIKWELEC